MQLFLRDSSTQAVEVSEHVSVRDLKAAFALKAYGVDISDGMVLIYGSRQLDEYTTLHAAGVSAGASISVCSRLRGGGGDGGSTGAESRSCYLEMYAQKKPDKVNPAEEVLARSTRCRLSGERLAQPCVADELGSLFNKEALVHALLNKAMPPALAYITSLKSVINLKLDPVPRSKTAASAAPGPSSARNGRNGKNGSSNSSDADFQCPLTGLELNGRFPFVIHRPSGVVLSERALREVPAACEELLGAKWTADDLIPVNPQGGELEKRQQQVAAALAAERAKRKAKKASKDKDKVAAEAGADGGKDQTAGAAGAAGSKRPVSGPPGAAADGVVAKKLKTPLGATSEVYASIFCSGKQTTKNDFLVRGASKGV